MGLFEWLFGSDKKEEEKEKVICQTAPKEWGESGTKKYYYESYLHNLIMRSKDYFLVDVYDRYGNYIKSDINDYWFHEYFEVYDKRYGIVPQCEVPQGAKDLNEIEPVKFETYRDKAFPWEKRSTAIKNANRIYFNTDHRIVEYIRCWDSVCDILEYDTKRALKILNKVFKYQLELEKKEVEESDDSDYESYYGY